MKTRSTHILLLLLLSFTFLVKAQTNTFSFNIKNAENDSLMIAYYYGNKQYILGDNGVNQMVRLNNKGIGTFERKDMKPGIYLIVFPPKNEYVEFIFDGTDLNISLDKNNTSQTIHVKDNETNKVFHNWVRFLAEMRKEKAAIDKQKKETPNSNFDKQYNALNKKVKEAQNQMFKNHPNNMSALLFKMNIEPVIPKAVKEKNKNAGFYYYRAHFFDNVDFSKDWTIRTPNFHNKVMRYMDKLTVQHPDSINKNADYILKKAKANDDIFKYCLITLTNKYAKSKVMGFDAVYTHLVKNYYLKGLAPWAEGENLRKMEKRVAKLENSLIGNKAINFKMKSLDGDISSLYDFKADYTILYLMDPDCGNCEKMSSKFIELKETLSKNAKILGIAFNTRIEDVKSIKQKNNYFWDINLPADSSNEILLRKNYDISSFPIIYVLDKDKKIIAKRINPEQTISLINRLNSPN